MRSTVGLCLILLCTACVQLGSAPQPQNFHLLSALAEPDRHADVTGQLLFARIEFPEYLDRPQLVARWPAGQLKIFSADRWGEPLQENLTRVIKENLRRQLPQLRIDDYPWQTAHKEGVLLTLSIYQFDGILGRQTNVDIRWSLSDPLSRQTLAFNHFRAELPIGERPEELVFGLSRATEQLSASIVRKLTELKRQSGEQP